MVPIITFGVTHSGASYSAEFRQTSLVVEDDSVVLKPSRHKDYLYSRAFRLATAMFL